MNVCIRVDASTVIGTGHVMRCLTIAQEIERNGHQVIFISRLLEGHLCDLIADKGFHVIKLKKAPTSDQYTNNLKHSNWLGVCQRDDANETLELLINTSMQFDWMIVDHYAIDINWENQIKKYIPRIMVIDDIADRKHNCEILLDQNYYLNSKTRYANLVSRNCVMLLGPKFSLLRDEFINLYKVPKQQIHQKSALVFYGGSDPTNETTKTINAINEMKPTSLKTHVVVGPSNPNKEKIKDQCDQETFIYHYNIDYMAKLMHKVDFAICAGGSTTWERYCVGTPAIITAVAYNQIELCENVQHLGIDRYIGVSGDVSQKRISKEVKSLLEVNSTLHLSTKARRIVDGHGKTRVLELLEKI